MAWDTDKALEGIFMFGGPLNVHKYEIDSGKFGQSTTTYHVIHFQLDDNPDLEARLDAKLRGPMQYFPMLYLLRRGYVDPSQWKQENVFYRPWLFTLLRGYGGTRSPFYEWPGPTLGIACYKKFNPHIITTDW